MDTTMHYLLILLVAVSSVCLVVIIAIAFLILGFSLCRIKGLRKDYRSSTLWTSTVNVTMSDPVYAIWLVCTSVIRMIRNVYILDPELQLDDILVKQLESWIMLEGANTYCIMNPRVVVGKFYGTGSHNIDKVVYDKHKSLAVDITLPDIGTKTIIIDFTFPYVNDFSDEFPNLNLSKKLLNHILRESKKPDYVYLLAADSIISSNGCLFASGIKTHPIKDIYKGGLNYGQ